VRLDVVKPEGVKLRMQETRRFVEAELRDLQKLVDAEPRTARIELGKRIQKRIVLKPEGKTYVAV